MLSTSGRNRGPWPAFGYSLMMMMVMMRHGHKPLYGIYFHWYSWWSEQIFVLLSILYHCQCWEALSCHYCCHIKLNAHLPWATNTGRICGCLINNEHWSCSLLTTSFTLLFDLYKVTATNVSCPVMSIVF